MFRSIPPWRLSHAHHPVSVLLKPFTSNVKPKLRSLSLQTYPNLISVKRYPPRTPLLVSKLLFSTTQLRSISESEKSSKLKQERKNVLKQKLEVDPEHVTSTSSLTPILDPRPTISTDRKSSDEPDMLRGLKSDLRTIKETFEMQEVPKEVLYVGMGGLVPYLGTSLTTLYLSWDINYAAEHGMGYLVSNETAEHLLHVLEPLQIGLGAVILSFLGAVHWGLEMAEYGGKHPYKRYSLSILAPMLAWPTLMLPIDYALLAQFVGFTGMYFADSTATTRGWAPKWYMTYRFLLTFVVGASIVVTLVARGQIGDRISKIKGPASYLQDLRDSQWENLRKEDEERRRNLKQEEIEAKKTEKTAAENKDEDESKDGGDEENGDKKQEGKTNKPATGPEKRAKDNK